MSGRLKCRARALSVALIFLSSFAAAQETVLVEIGRCLEVHEGGRGPTRGLDGHRFCRHRLAGWQLPASVTGMATTRPPSAT